ncbi:MAG: alpha/beta fold hydrolase [Thermoanaerobaculaceae bacterium]|nr:alpha/beta fold hydrolase [Thermoanaerobaculaceae bacterium]
MGVVRGLLTETAGSGPPVLVMHGGMGMDHRYFRPWLDTLGRGATLVYYDHRGNGGSDDPDDWQAFGLAQWAADADAVRASVGADRIVVLGHSCAVFLALEYARRYPQRVAGLILCAGAPVIDYGETILALATARGTAAQLAGLTALFTAAKLDDESFKAHYLAALPLYFHRYRPEYGEHIGRSVRFGAKAFLHGRVKLFAEFDSRPWLPTIGVPALVIGGRDDIIAPVSAGAERLANGLPQAELVLFAASGHFPFVEETERFAEVVSGWLARQGQAG